MRGYFVAKIAYRLHHHALLNRVLIAKKTLLVTA